MRPHRAILALLYLIAFTALAHWLSEGWSYYRTPLIERPHHPQFWSLKPGGTLGQAFGITGAGLMTVMLLYSVRKRVKPLRKAGPLNVWLDFHIFCGVIGPLLVILHSSFKVQGLVALSFWSMIAVALSGVLGRYLYLQIPRTRAGDERTLADVEAESRTLSAQLRDLGLDEERLAELEGIASTPRAWQRRSRLRAFERQHGGRQLVAVIERKADLHRRILRWHRLQEIFHHWHVFHKPFAIVMYLFLIVHITVVTVTGYGFR
ncbi:MAG TPA: hypothetical protein VEK57_23510 [Thermoanaerobaculia bacterium]|nr:hypothetical protein [Thermoanaerobaculia bacterium]